jgi:prepilin-type N-terminal cleavage/methylation domain-containing protein
VANNKGFTLPEILVTIVILSIGVCALAGMQVSNIKGTSFSKDASIATGLAQAQLEALKNTTFNSITSGNATDATTGMTAAWTVSTSGTTPNRYHDVSVTVAWGEGSITCCTIITEP